MVPSMAELAAMGVKIVAPAMWRMITTDANGVFKASPYTKAAKANGLDMIAWTLERSGPFPQVSVSPFFMPCIYVVCPFASLLSPLFSHLSGVLSLFTSIPLNFPIYLLKAANDWYFTGLEMENSPDGDGTYFKVLEALHKVIFVGACNCLLTVYLLCLPVSFALAWPALVCSCLPLLALVILVCSSRSQSFSGFSLGG
jgi:hypothetical protein